MIRKSVGALHHTFTIRSPYVHHMYTDRCSHVNHSDTTVNDILLSTTYTYFNNHEDRDISLLEIIMVGDISHHDNHNNVINMKITEQGFSLPLSNSKLSTTLAWSSIAHMSGAVLLVISGFWWDTIANSP